MINLRLSLVRTIFFNVPFYRYCLILLKKESIRSSRACRRRASVVFRTADVNKTRYIHQEAFKRGLVISETKNKFTVWDGEGKQTREAVHIHTADWGTYASFQEAGIGYPNLRWVYYQVAAVSRWCCLKNNLIVYLCLFHVAQSL